jgi:hypothetical protein
MQLFRKFDANKKENVDFTRIIRVRTNGRMKA